MIRTELSICLTKLECVAFIFKKDQNTCCGCVRYWMEVQHDLTLIVRVLTPVSWVVYVPEAHQLTC